MVSCSRIFRVNVVICNSIGRSLDPSLTRHAPRLESYFHHLYPPRRRSPASPTDPQICDNERRGRESVCPLLCLYRQQLNTLQLAEARTRQREGRTTATYRIDRQCVGQQGRPEQQAYSFRTGSFRFCSQGRARSCTRLQCRRGQRLPEEE